MINDRQSPYGNPTNPNQILLQSVSSEQFLNKEQLDKLTDNFESLDLREFCSEGNKINIIVDEAD